MVKVICIKLDWEFNPQIFVNDTPEFDRFHSKSGWLDIKIFNLFIFSTH